MIKVTDIMQTCYACPSQWEGRTDDGSYVYVRFRWGQLRVSLADTLDNAIAGKYGDAFSAYLDDGWTGIMTLDELKGLTKGIIEWP